MIVRVRLMAQHLGGDRLIDWPMWASGAAYVPRIGETITLRDGETYTVEYVDYYPRGDADSPRPYVYVVAR